MSLQIIFNIKCGPYSVFSGTGKYLEKNVSLINGSFPISQYVPVIPRFPQLPGLSFSQGCMKGFRIRSVPDPGLAKALDLDPKHTFFPLHIH